ncbi:MAG: hypothetical protein ABFR53_11920, partial [Actinomycetota bacterium]
MRSARSEDRPDLQFGPAAFAMFAFLAVSGTITVLGESDLVDIVGVSSVFGATTISGLLMLRNAAALDGQERLAWSLVGAGLLAAAGGVFSVAAVFVIAGDAPAFGWTDLFFFAAYALMIGGFAALPHTQGSTLQRWRMVIDGLIGAVSIGALVWVYFISDVMQDFGDLSPVERVIGAIYPFFDLLVFTVALLVLLRRSTFRFDSR